MEGDSVKKEKNFSYYDGPVKDSGRTAEEIEKAIEKYMPIKKVDKVKEYMKPVLYKLGIIKVAKRVRQIIE